MYSEMKRRLLNLKSQFDNVLKSMEELKELDRTLPVNLKQGNHLYLLTQALKTEFGEVWEKIERMRSNKNSIPPLELEEIEEYDSAHEDDAFLQAVDISEGLFTCLTALLPTLVVRAVSGEDYTPVRALLNLEPKIHLITNRCREKLNLPLNPLRPIFDPLEESMTGIVGMTSLTICPHYSRTPLFPIEAFVTQNPFADTPVVRVHNSVKQQLHTYVLCDPGFDIPGEIELSINLAQLPSCVNTLQKHHVPGTQCSAFNTIFGWAVTGMAPVAEIRRTLWMDSVIDSITQKIQTCDEFFRTYFPGLPN